MNKPQYGLVPIEVSATQTCQSANNEPVFMAGVTTCLPWDEGE